MKRLLQVWLIALMSLSSVLIFGYVITTPVTARHNGIDSDQCVGPAIYTEPDHTCIGDSTNPGADECGDRGGIVVTLRGGSQCALTPEAVELLTGVRNLEHDLDNPEPILVKSVCGAPDGGDNTIPLDDDPNETCDCEGTDLDASNCGIIRFLQIGINILTGIAGIAIVGSIMVAGFQYMTARDNPGVLQAARVRIVWALVALLILVFFYGILQWLVPGGVL